MISAGTLVSGHLIDRLTRRSKTAYATAPAVSLLLVMNFIGLGLTDLRGRCERFLPRDPIPIIPCRSRSTL